MTIDFPMGPPHLFKAVSLSGQEFGIYEGLMHSALPKCPMHQATGLTDAKGQDVYAGDVLINVKDPDFPMVEMVWHEGEFRLKKFTEDDPRIALLNGQAKGWLDVYSVIGNGRQRESTLGARALELYAEHQGKAGKPA